MITLNYTIVGLVDFEYNDLSDWLTLLVSVLFYFLSIYFIYRRNLIGCLIIIYMASSDLIFSHEVIPAIVSFSLFQSGPQLVLTNILNLMILVFAAIGTCLIILKYFKPQLFQQTTNNAMSGNFFKRHQLDMVLASIILVLLAIYWLVWWACTTHI